MRVLELKNRLGLFEDPYRTCSPERRTEVTCTPERLESARKTCDEALVLLKNEAGCYRLRPGATLRAWRSSVPMPTAETSSACGRFMPIKLIP